MHQHNAMHITDANQTMKSSGTHKNR